MMLKDSKAFSSFSVNDIAKAKDFYSKTLGLQVSEENGMLNLHIVGEDRLLIYPKPNHTPASFTVLNFMVDNIGQTVDDLTGRGVRFERYEGIPADARGIVTVAGASIKQAWFQDPAENIISLIEAL